VRWALSDSLVIARRILLTWSRLPAYIVFTVIQPVLFVVMFRYAVGGVVHLHLPGGYVSFLLPTAIAEAALWATSGAGLGLAHELRSGMIDRLRAMPIARSAVLAGHLIAVNVQMLTTMLIISGVGYAIGGRFENGAVAAVALVLLAVAFGQAIACISAFTGLAVRRAETVAAVNLIWLFPGMFLSSALAPTQTMPGWLQAFASNQPVTFVIDTMRALAEPGLGSRVARVSYHPVGRRGSDHPLAQGAP
jgi:ABC transporter DrrB family efflux protein